MKKLVGLIIVLFLTACSSENNSETNNDNSENTNTELTGDRKELYDLIMTYRKEKKLTTIPLSKSLNFVAQTHAKDLEENQPNKGNCNLHSWSDKGNWIPVCYTSDHKEASKMWSKPKELTSYQGKGYEISYMHSLKATPEGALQGWKNSSGHNDVIVENGSWSNWNAIGIGIYGKYAVVWFGHEKDNNN